MNRAARRAEKFGKRNWQQRANSLRDGVAIANLCARDVRALKDQP
jgi:hypothetical protein